MKIRLYRLLREFGFDPRKTYFSIISLKNYLKDLRKIKKEIRKNNKEIKIKLYPCLSDKYDTAGICKGHYFHQDLLVAQKIFEDKPKKHVDFGSRIDGFVAHVASFREVEVFDIRKIKCKSKNITFTQLDITNISKDYYEYCDSLSCLHVLEHIGLGRYGDRLDLIGHKKAFENLKRILKKSGKLYFSVPFGKERIEFNAHRVFSITELIDMIGRDFKILSFSYIDDKGDLFKDVVLNKDMIKKSEKINYGCAIFELKKK